MIEKFKVGQRVRYVQESIESRPEEDNQLPNDYIILAVEDNKGFIYPKKNPRRIVGSDTSDGKFTWAVSRLDVELIEEKSEPLKIEYEEPEEDEFTDNCVSTCRPGEHACKTK